MMNLQFFPFGEYVLSVTMPNTPKQKMKLKIQFDINIDIANYNNCNYLLQIGLRPAVCCSVFVSRFDAITFLRSIRNIGSEMKHFMEKKDYSYIEKMHLILR